MINWNKHLNFSSAKNNKLLFWFAGASFFMALFIKFTAEVFEDDKILKIDNSILTFIGSHLRYPFFNGIAVDITAMGSPTVITIVSITAISALIFAKDRLGAIYLFLTVSGATILMAVLKFFIARPRPQIITHLVEVQGLSYPSGHSLIATATYLAIALLVCRYIKSIKKIVLLLLLTMLLISLIALSRLYLGVHYPSDVMSGIFFGISWVLLLTAIFKMRVSNKNF